MSSRQHKPINIIRLIGDIGFSILAKALQTSVYGGRIGIIPGLIIGAASQIFFAQKTTCSASDIIESAVLGMAFIGLTGFIIGGLTGIVIGTLTACRNGKFYELYRYSMAWLGASPPPEYKSLRTDVKIEVGIGRFILQACFWISFWAVEGGILGAIGGIFFGLFGFAVESFTEAINSMAFWLAAWGMIGAIAGIMIGPYMWLTSQIVKKIRIGGFSAESPFLSLLLTGGGIGDRIFNKLFGENQVGK